MPGDIGADGRRCHRYPRRMDNASGQFIVGLRIIHVFWTNEAEWGWVLVLGLRFIAGVRIDVARMPTISAFYGILIRMFFNDHPPPHFHARYGEFEAIIEIATLNVLEGTLPPRALRLVQEWAMMHGEDLMADWRLCRQNARPVRIEPLS